MGHRGGWYEEQASGLYLGFEPGIQIVDTPMKPQAPVNADFAAGSHQDNRTLLPRHIGSITCCQLSILSLLLASSSTKLVIEWRSAPDRLDATTNYSPGSPAAPRSRPSTGT